MCHTDTILAHLGVCVCTYFSTSVLCVHARAQCVYVCVYAHERESVCVCVLCDMCAYVSECVHHECMFVCVYVCLFA